MYDLEVRYSDHRLGAVEVTAAADAELIEFWNLVNSPGGWRVESLVGGWSVSIEPSARVKRVLQELPNLLLSFEQTGVRDFHIGRSTTPSDTLARQLRVVRALQSPTDFPGSIYVTPELALDRMSGMVAENGDDLAEWVSEFLTGPAQQDVRHKLASSGAAETHAVVLFPGFSPAPFAVTDLLMRDDAPLPTIDPRLPPEITDVWAMSDWTAGVGFRWSRLTGWLRFDKLGPDHTQRQ